jgi:hypothetical protein
MKADQEHLEEELMASLEIQIGWPATHIDVNQEKVDT